MDSKATDRLSTRAHFIKKNKFFGRFVEKRYFNVNVKKVADLPNYFVRQIPLNGGDNHHDFVRCALLTISYLWTLWMHISSFVLFCALSQLLIGIGWHSVENRVAEGMGALEPESARVMGALNAEAESYTGRERNKL